MAISCACALTCFFSRWVFFLLNLISIIKYPKGHIYPKIKRFLQMQYDKIFYYKLYNPWNSPGQNTGGGWLFPSPGDVPNPGIERRSPTLQADSLPSVPPGKVLFNKNNNKYYFNNKC